MSDVREILFKAKRKNWEELPIDQWWVEGYIVRPCTCDVDKKPLTYYFNAYDERGWNEEVIVLAETVCQYTGLPDKNRRNIWENDIVSNEWCFACGYSVVRFGEYKDFHMPETFQCGNLGFYLEHTHKRNKNCRKDMMYFAGKCEVIGNAFDNPALLEQEDAE